MDPELGEMAAVALRGYRRPSEDELIMMSRVALANPRRGRGSRKRKRKRHPRKSNKKRRVAKKTRDRRKKRRKETRKRKRSKR